MLGRSPWDPKARTNGDCAGIRRGGGRRVVVVESRCSLTHLIHGGGPNLFQGRNHTSRGQEWHMLTHRSSALPRVVSARLRTVSVTPAHQCSAHCLPLVAVMPIRAQDKGVEDRMAARAEALYEQQRKDRAALKSAPSTTKPKPDPFAADADPYNRVKLLNNPSPRSTKASATATSPRGYTPGTASANRPRYRSTYP